MTYSESQAAVNRARRTHTWTHSLASTEMPLPTWVRLWGALGHADGNFPLQGAHREDA